MHAKLAKRLTTAKSVLEPCLKAVSKMMAEFRFFVGQKCAHKVFNYICNCVKLRELTFKKLGRKYVTFFAGGIVVSEKITTFASQ